MKRFARALLGCALLAGAAQAQITGPFGVYGGPIPSASLPPANLVPTNTIAFTSDQGMMVDNGSAWVLFPNSIPAGTTIDAGSVTQTSSTDTLAPGLFPGSSVRYPASTSVTIAGSDGSNVVDDVNAAAITVTLPQSLAGTSVAPGQFQTLYVDGGAGLSTLTPTTSTINGAASAYLPQNGWMWLFTDTSGGNGNYLGLTGGGYTFNSAGLAIWPNGIKVPIAIFSGTGVGSAGQGWCNNASNGSGLGCGAGANYAFQVLSATTENVEYAGVAVAQGTVPTVTCITNCIANNNGVGQTVTFTTSSASITAASNSMAPNQPVQLTTTGTFPTNFAGSTTYYVNITGLAAGTMQLCATPMAAPAGGAWTGCTSIVTGASAGTGTITATPTSSNYIAYGGAQRFILTLPEGTYSGAPTYKFTWPADANVTIGYACGGSADITSAAQLTQNGMTTISCSLVKGTAAAALDFLVIQAGAM